MRKRLEKSKELGIRLDAEYSTVLVLVLTAWVLTGIVGTQVYPHWGWLNWLAAGVLALLVFATLLVHELGHALAAISTGAQGYRMNLLSASRIPIQTEPASPFSEFASAIAGPLSNIAVGGFLLLFGIASMGTITRLPSEPPPHTMLLLGLGGINLLLGGLNLLPAAPLDGGWILHALFRVAWSDEWRAARWTARISRLIAWASIAVGLVISVQMSQPFSGTGLVLGFGLVICGWLLERAAEPMRSLVPLDIARTGARRQMIPPNIPVSSLVNDYLLSWDDSVCPVIDHGRVVGLVHLADVRQVPLERWDITEVGEIMLTVSQQAEARTAV